MKKVITILAALGLSLSGLSYAQPVKMTDAQMDQVTAGGSLIHVHGHVHVKLK